MSSEGFDMIQYEKVGAKMQNNKNKVTCSGHPIREAHPYDRYVWSTRWTIHWMIDCRGG